MGPAGCNLQLLGKFSSGRAGRAGRGCEGILSLLRIPGPQSKPRPCPRAGGGGRGGKLGAWTGQCRFAEMPLLHASLCPTPSAAWRWMSASTVQRTQGQERHGGSTVQGSVSWGCCITLPLASSASLNRCQQSTGRALLGVLEGAALVGGWPGSCWEPLVTGQHGLPGCRSLR